MQEAAITDVKSYTQASSRAAVAATAAATAVAVTKVHTAEGPALTRACSTLPHPFVVGSSIMQGL